MAREEDLNREFDRLTANTGASQASWGDARTTSAIGYLGKAVLRLDKTSSRLATVNIVLTAVILIVGLIQIVLMLRGH
jgi:hypothetical protein